MRNGLIYFILAGLFVYLAIINATETIWNPLSVTLLIIASIDIGMGITMFRNYLRQKKQEESK